MQERTESARFAENYYNGLKAEYTKLQSTPETAIDESRYERGPSYNASAELLGLTPAQRKTAVVRARISALEDGFNNPNGGQCQARIKSCKIELRKAADKLRQLEDRYEAFLQDPSSELSAHFEIPAQSNTSLLEADIASSYEKQIASSKERINTYANEIRALEGTKDCEPLKTTLANKQTALSASNDLNVEKIHRVLDDAKKTPLLQRATTLH